MPRPRNVVPRYITADKAYDSDELRDAFAGAEIQLLAPHRSNRTARTRSNDGRCMRRYKRRWIVERFLAWLNGFRRLFVRHERHSLMYRAFGSRRMRPRHHACFVKQVLVIDTRQDVSASQLAQQVTGFLGYLYPIAADVCEIVTYPNTVDIRVGRHHLKLPAQHSIRHAEQHGLVAP